MANRIIRIKPGIANVTTSINRRRSSQWLSCVMLWLVFISGTGISSRVQAFQSIHDYMQPLIDTVTENIFTGDHGNDFYIRIANDVVVLPGVNSYPRFVYYLFTQVLGYVVLKG